MGIRFARDNESLIHGNSFCDVTHSPERSLGKWRFDLWRLLDRALYSLLFASVHFAVGDRGSKKSRVIALEPSHR